MQIPLGVYPDYPTLTTLESLTLKLAREIVSVQKNPVFNSGTQDVISLIGDEEKEIITVTCDNWEAQLLDGQITVKNYFPGHTFAHGTGTYPYNRFHLCDALFHAVIYQQLQELNLSKNPGDGNQLCSFNSTNASTKGRSLNFDVSFSITNLPTQSVQITDGLTIKARPYLQD
jgi:hypothetical protein